MSKSKNSTSENSAIAKAAALLKAAEQQKIEQCGEELEKLMTKYGCVLEPQIIIRGTRIYAQMIIIANPAPDQQMQKMTNLKPAEEKEA